MPYVRVQLIQKVLAPALAQTIAVRHTVLTVKPSPPSERVTWQTQISGEEATIVTVEKVALDMVIVDTVMIEVATVMTVEAQEETGIVISGMVVVGTTIQGG